MVGQSVFGFSVQQLTFKISFFSEHIVQLAQLRVHLQELPGGRRVHLSDRTEAGQRQQDVRRQERVRGVGVLRPEMHQQRRQSLLGCYNPNSMLLQYNAIHPILCYVLIWQHFV